MATQYTSLLGLALPVTGELQGTWGDTVNNSITSLLDTAVAGTTTLSTDGDVTLSTTTGASNQARQAVLLCTGARTALRTIVAPAQSKTYTVINATTGGFSIKVVGVGPTTGVTIVAGESALIAWNGSDFIKISNTGGSASFTNVTVSGTTTLSGLTASTALALDASKNVVSVTNTGTGNNVLSASPTLTGTVAGASLQLSSLTSGRVTYATTSGLLTDSANMTFNGTRLTVADLADSGLTATRVVFSTTGGALTDSANLTFNGTDLTVSGAVNAGTINATTLDLTNLEVTNIKAKDGTAGMQIADSTGVVSFTANPVMSGGTANGVAYLNGSKVLTTGSALTFDGTNFATTGSVTSAGASNSGNLAFTGTGNRITGDFTNATIANRVMFQTSTANSSSAVSVLPSGTSSTSAFQTYNNSDPTNASLGSLIVDSGALSLQSTIRGTGTYLPMTFWTGNSERMRLDTSGNLGVGTSIPGTYDAKLAVNGNISLVTIGQKFYPYYISATNHNYISSAAGGEMVFGTGTSSPAERMRIDSGGNVGIGTSTMGSTGVSLPATYNLGWVQSAGESVPNIFRQTSSAATVVANGYRQSATANGFASSFSSSFAKSAIALNDGSVRFYTDTAAAVAAGTDVTPTERMRIDSAGNVGIGTSSPGYALQVTRSGAAAYVANTDGTGTLLSGVNGSGLGVYGTFSNTAVAFFSNSTEQMRLTSTGLGIGRSSPYTKLDVASGSTAQPTLGSPTAYAAVFQNGVGGGGYGLGISTQSSGNVWLQSQRYDGTATAYDMVLQPLGGNLGLGVTPSAWGSWTGKGVFQFGNTGAYLHGGGTGWSGGNYMYFGNNGYYNGTNWIYSRTNGATQYVQLDSQHQWLTAPSGTAGNAISFTQAMTLDANGDFLIGTTSAPANGANARNVVFNNPNSVATYVKISNAASGATASDGFDLVIGTTGDTYVYNRENGPMIFGTNNTERARIDSSGNLLVGTTSGSNRITAVNSGSLAAAIRCENSRNVSGDFALTTQLGSNCNNTSSYHIISATGGADRFYVFGNGNVQNQNNSYGAISDAKLKENVTDATPKLEKLNQVRVVNYNLIGETQKQIGVIAQELEQIFPGMVEETPDRDAEGNELGTTTKSVKYSVFVPMLIKAIQEQQAIIDAQQAALNQLKADVAALKGA